VEHQPDQIPPAGHVPLPTYYFEDRKSSVQLKFYARHEKLPGWQFGELIVRLEWTLKGKAALTRHLGGNQIEHLLGADLDKFLQRNLYLEEVDHVALGNLFRWIRRTKQRGATPGPAGAARIQKQWQEQNYRAERAAFLVLRKLAYREHELAKFASWEQTLWACQNSPAQIRGYLRELRDGMRLGRRGRPKIMPRADRTAITDYKINGCFRTIQLRAARSPV
jgi:hypothetical protein